MSDMILGRKKVGLACSGLPLVWVDYLVRADRLADDLPRWVAGEA